VRTDAHIALSLRACLVAVLCACGLNAQHLDLSLSRDTIGYNETVVLTITGEIPDFNAPAELPTPDGLVVISRVTDYSYNSNNGKVNLYQTFTLQPYSTGTFSLGPASIQAGSKRIFSNKASVTITGSGKANSIANNIFLRCDIDKKKVMIGEEVAVYVRLYSRQPNVTQSDEWPKAKAFNGFWYVPGPYDQYYPDTALYLNGIKYYVQTIHKEYLFPNATGTLKIPSFHYPCTVTQIDHPTGDEFVDNQLAYELPLDLHSEEVPIEVYPFPDENKPADFLGDAGQYKLEASIDRLSLKAWEAATLLVTISGEGNVSFVQLPKQNFPAGLKSYPAVAHDTMIVTTEGISGSKTFSITLIPEKEGKFTVPGVTFSYYDVRKKDYVTLTSRSFTLDVAPGPPPETLTESNIGGTEDESGGTVLRVTLFVLIPALLLGAFLIYRKRKKKNAAVAESTTVVQQEVAAPPKVRIADTVVPNAERFLLAGQPMAAISSLYEGFMNACCQKCELSREEASVHQLRYRMLIKAIPPETTEQILEHSALLSRLRYTPSEVTPSLMVEIMQKTQVLLTNL
jgi:hypothetical protein